MMISRSPRVEIVLFSMMKKSFKNQPKERAAKPSPKETITPFWIFSGNPFLKITPKMVATTIAIALIIVPIHTSCKIDQFVYKYLMKRLGTKRGPNLITKEVDCL